MLRLTGYAIAIQIVQGISLNAEASDKADQMFREYDADRSGGLSYAEFQEAFMEFDSNTLRTFTLRPPLR